MRLVRIAERGEDLDDLGSAFGATIRRSSQIVPAAPTESLTVMRRPLASCMNPECSVKQVKEHESDDQDRRDCEEEKEEHCPEDRHEQILVPTRLGGRVWRII